MGTTNGKPPGPIIMIGQSKRGMRSQIIFITLFSSMCTYLRGFSPASANWANMHQKNYFPEPNRHIFTFLHPILIVEGCILSAHDWDDASDYNQECLSSTSWTWSWFSSTLHHLFNVFVHKQLLWTSFRISFVRQSPRLKVLPKEGLPQSHSQTSAWFW